VKDTDKPRIEKLKNARALWDAHAKVWQARGFDIEQVLTEWATEQGQRLASPGARTDFVELCTDGCTSMVLATLMALFRHSPRLERYWAEMVGHPDNRQKTARALENAAATLEHVFGEFIAVEDEGQRAELAKIGRLPFSLVVSELRFYIKFIHFAELLNADTESHSLAEDCKNLLASYAKKMTGRFHDRNLSVLVGEIAGPADYNEVAQRMWRGRNYKRLDEHFTWMTEFLVDMSLVISARRNES
jgi:hypothetical protein